MAWWQIFKRLVRPQSTTIPSAEALRSDILSDFSRTVSEHERAFTRELLADMDKSRKALRYEAHVTVRDSETTDAHMQALSNVAARFQAKGYQTTINREGSLTINWKDAPKKTSSPSGNRSGEKQEKKAPTKITRSATGGRLRSRDSDSRKSR